MIYAMSDIHGCIGELQKNMEQVDLGGDNRIVFCGDYIDYGDSSYYVLKYLWDLQKKYGAEKLWFLRVTMSKCFWIGLRITETYIQMEQKIAGLSMIGFARILSMEQIP